MSNKLTIAGKKFEAVEDFNFCCAGCAFYYDDFVECCCPVDPNCNGNIRDDGRHIIWVEAAG